MGEVRRPGSQAHLAQRLPGYLLRPGPPGDIGAELDVLQRGQPGEQVEALEHEADRVTADHRPLRPRRGGQVLPVQPDRARRGRVQRADQVQQRDLA
jgi:hypothetical protein